MPSKLKKAIAVVKDQTSISLAMVKTGRAHSSSAALEVAILKATSHDDSPINPHHVAHILRVLSSDGSMAPACARSLGRRVGRTRSSMVALKCLLLVLRLLQSDDPHFPRELLLAMKAGYRILNLHDVSFSGSSSRHLASFVRSFAAYLSARLLLAPGPAAAAPDALLDRIPRLQRLLDKAIAMGPTRGPPSNRLVLAALHEVVRESFALYKDVSDGLALLLDGFFHLQHASCVTALDAFVVAAKQFESLRGFYDLCLSSGIGTPSEYPAVKDIPAELIETLQEFVKDQSSFPATSSGRRLPLSLIGSCSSPKSGDVDRHSDPGDHKADVTPDLSPMGDFTASVLSDSDFRQYSFDLLDHEEGAAMLQGGTSSRGENEDEESSDESDDGNRTTPSGWELELLETTTMMQQPSSPGVVSNGDFIEAGSTPSLLTHPCSEQYNPFLQDAVHTSNPMDVYLPLAFDNGYHATSGWVDFNDNGKADSIDKFASTIVPVESDPFSSSHNATVSDEIVNANSGSGFDAIVPTFKAAAPVEVASGGDQGHEEHSWCGDPFGSSVDLQNVQNQRQMWLKIQNKILAKHLA